MLTEQLGASITEAFARLRAYAYAQDKRLSDIAHDIVTRRLRLDPDPPGWNEAAPPGPPGREGDAPPRARQWRRSRKDKRRWIRNCSQTPSSIWPTPWSPTSTSSTSCICSPTAACSYSARRRPG